MDTGGGQLTSGPSLASWGEGRLDCFARGPNGELLHRDYRSAWQNLGGKFVGTPAAVSWGPNRIDVVVRGMNDSLWHRAWDGTRWTGWADLGGGRIASSPSLISRGPGQLDCFAATAKGTVIHRMFAENAWSEWVERNCGGIIKDTPAAVHSGNGRIDIVALGMDDNAWTTSMM